MHLIWGILIMKGTLRLNILFLINKSPRNGYTILKDIEEINGKRPSPGSLYPLLQELSKNNYIYPEKKARSIEYSITSRGSIELRNLINDFFNDIDEMIYIGRLLDYKYLPQKIVGKKGSEICKCCSNNGKCFEEVPGFRCHKFKSNNYEDL
jgi:DNA-binding PadR family transcriptional regulator